MGWATHYIEALKQGKTISFRPHGRSMTGKIESGQLVTVRPLLVDEELVQGDIVLCKVKGSEFLHLVSAIRGDQFQISNNKNHVNGWVTRNSIFGKCTQVDP